MLAHLRQLSLAGGRMHAQHHGRAFQAGLLQLRRVHLGCRRAACMRSMAGLQRDECSGLSAAGGGNASTGQPSPISMQTDSAGSGHQQATGNRLKAWA